MKQSYLYVLYGTALLAISIICLKGQQAAAPNSIQAYNDGLQYRKRILTTLDQKTIDGIIQNYCAHNYPDQAAREACIEGAKAYE